MMVSTIHSGIEVIKRRRRRPRENQHNKQYLLLLFGDKAVAHVEIPRVIDFYNHKMEGVGVSDLLNAGQSSKCADTGQQCGSMMLMWQRVYSYVKFGQ